MLQGRSTPWMLLLDKADAVLQVAFSRSTPPPGQGVVAQPIKISLAIALARRPLQQSAPARTARHSLLPTESSLNFTAISSTMETMISALPQLPIGQLVLTAALESATASALSMNQSPKPAISALTEINPLP